MLLFILEYHYTRAITGLIMLKPIRVNASIYWVYPTFWLPEWGNMLIGCLAKLASIMKTKIIFWKKTVLFIIEVRHRNRSLLPTCWSRFMWKYCRFVLMGQKKGRFIIEDALGLTYLSRNKNTYLKPFLDLGLIDFPVIHFNKSKQQAYALTDCGFDFLRQHMAESAVVWFFLLVRSLLQQQCFVMLTTLMRYLVLFSEILIGSLRWLDDYFNWVVSEWNIKRIRKIKKSQLHQDPWLLFIGLL